MTNYFPNGRKTLNCTQKNAISRLRLSECYNIYELQKIKMRSKFCFSKNSSISMNSLCEMLGYACCEFS